MLMILYTQYRFVAYIKCQSGEIETKEYFFNTLNIKNVLDCYLHLVYFLLFLAQNLRFWRGKINKQVKL